MNAKVFEGLGKALAHLEAADKLKDQAAVLDRKAKLEFTKTAKGILRELQAQDAKRRNPDLDG